MSWVGSKRVRAPGVRMDELPEIDYVLISHDHYDHLDLPSIEKIVERHNPAILVGLGIKAFLVARGIYNIVEMDWWQSCESKVPNVRFTFVPAIHQSGRSPFRTNRTLWGGFVIESPAGQVYFAGDTAFGSFLFR